MEAGKTLRENKWKLGRNVLEEETPMAHRIQRWFMLRPWQRHGLVLLIGGLTYIALGFWFIITGDDLSPRRTVQLVVALRMFPLQTWGLVFIAAGILAVLSCKWPHFSDSWGYAVLCGLASGWSSINFLGMFYGDASLAYNITGALMWGLAAFLWWAVSGLVNPPRVKRTIYGAD